MQDHTTRGAKPGKSTPKKIAVGGNAHATTNQVTAKIIAIRAWVAGAISGFYLNRGIGLDVVLSLALLGIYAVWRAFA